MRLRQIEAFHAVMRTGGVGAAARLMALSQPAVTRTLRHAELQLGFALFVRDKGRMRPTAEAEALYPEIERLYAQLDAVRALAADLRQNRQVLRVYLIPALGARLLPLALARFAAGGEATKVAAHMHHSSDIVRALALLDADIGFAFDAPRHPNVQAEVLASIGLRCVVPRGEALRRRSVAWSDLAARRLIRLDEQDPLGLRVCEAAAAAGVRLEGDIRVQTYHAALAMAEQGLGWALVDAVTAAAADRSRVRVLPVHPAIEIPFTLLTPAIGRRHRQAPRLVECMREALRVLLAG
jgi:DNA-binding transcriptional LysR family regulator